MAADSHRNRLRPETPRAKDNSVAAFFPAGPSEPPSDEAAMAEISAQNFLAQVAELVDWEALTPALEELAARTGKKLPVSAIKIALLKQWYELADTSAEFTILDRLSFRDFVGLRGDGSSSDVEALNELREASWSGLRELRPVLEVVEQQLRDRGFNVQPGYIVEATIVASTDGELRELGPSVTAIPSPGELG